ncbi:MAG: DNA ligase D [Candidatus Nitrosocosmicus sp.]
MEEYNKKRNFNITPEPSGSNPIEKDPIENNKSDLDVKSRFVIQKHDASRLHYDFRLESKKKNALISWAVPKGPSTDPKVKRLAILTEDHPVDYLLFEGIIPKGNYGAGSVIVWDTGRYSIDVAAEGKDDEDVLDQFKKGKINFTLFGQKLNGKFSIIKTSRENQWLLIKVNDKFSFPPDKNGEKEGGKEEGNIEEIDLTKSSPESVLSGLTNNDLKELNTHKEFNKEIKKDDENKINIATKKNYSIPYTNNSNNNNNNNNDRLNTADHTNSFSISSLHKQEFPDNMIPMLATLLDKPFNSQDWIFEIKWDGVRSISFIHKSRGIFRIRSRNGNTITHRYPELAEPLRSAINGNIFRESIVFDGEIVVLDKDGFPDFQRHQKRMNIDIKKDIESLSRQFPATYYIFDILHLDGIDLKVLPLIERRKILENIIIRNKSNKRIQISDFIEGEGKDIFESIKRMNLEGMIVKYKLGKYYPDTRSKEWLKIKNTRTQDCVVIGYTRGEGNREKYFGSLLLAAIDNNKISNDNKFKFIGHCGRGFDFEQIPNIHGNLKKIKTQRCPIDHVPYTNRDTTWVKPALVVEIKFNDWTNEMIMRTPIFLRFREDKNPQECIIEENTKMISNNVMGSDKKIEKTKIPVTEIKDKDDSGSKGDRDFSQQIIKKYSSSSCSPDLHYNFSNPEKIYWDKSKFHSPITKKDLIDYYDQISSLILPHLKDRPLSLNRYPDGIGGKSFYHKNWQNYKPEYVQTIKVHSESKGGNINYLLCNNKETLLWLANLGCIEMHPWYSRVNNYDLNDNLDDLKVDKSGLNYPDFIVFDLDPYIYSGNEEKYQEPEYNLKAFKATVEIAFCLKDIFDKINIKPFVKTSGKTGLHIFIPIINLYTYEQTRSFAQIIGKILNKRLPGKITTKWNTIYRKGKVFFDYNQNSKGKTIASVFSPRPIDLATVSMLIEWKDLSDIIPTDFTINNIVEIFKIKKDPWKDILIEKQDLVKILNNITESSI